MLNQQEKIEMKIREFGKVLEKIKGLNISHRNMTDVRILFGDDRILFFLKGEYKYFNAIIWHKGKDY